MEQPKQAIVVLAVLVIYIICIWLYVKKRSKKRKTLWKEIEEVDAKISRLKKEISEFKKE